MKSGESRFFNGENMTYLLAWLVIGFISSVLTSTYNTEEVYEMRMRKYLSRKGLKREELPKEVTYETYKMFSFVLGTMYGIFSIIGFYSVRSDYMRTQKNKK